MRNPRHLPLRRCDRAGSGAPNRLAAGRNPGSAREKNRKVIATSGGILLAAGPGPAGLAAA
jgi:hypothetical protein